MQRNRRRRIGCGSVGGAALASLLLVAHGAAADDAGRPACLDDTRSARAILDCLAFAENSLRRWDDRHQRLQLTGFSGDRHQVTRDLDLYEKRLAQGRRGTLVVFRAPADIANTAFLALAEPAGRTMQWI